MVEEEGEHGDCEGGDDGSVSSAWCVEKVYVCKTVIK